ncbi:MAG: sugar ABC transporter permease [Alphaproteobacteria bacterium]|nr:sugar ABC transporter permease [Alphaproteobacteria bacterium]|tara:strand:- start:17808 stop:18794 length:987 start_codon:yes stop_codon:yes gene_type:complete
MSSYQTTNGTSPASKPGRYRRFDPNSKVLIGPLLITPIQILLLVLLVFPFMLEFFVSLTEWQPIYGDIWTALGQVFTEPIYQGINYNYLVTDEPRYLSALGRTLSISVLSLCLEFLIGLGMATIFLKSFYGKRIFFTALLTPMMIMPVVVGYTWYMLFQYNGPINQVLGWISGDAAGSGGVEWLNSATPAFFAVVVTEVWHWTPLFFLILLSGLNSIPANPLRAATVLGASNAKIFWTIMLPNMKGVIIIAFVIRGMEVIKLFDEVVLLTKGGPGTSTETISVYLYKLAFLDFRIAYAGAAAFIVLIITVVLINLMLKPIRYQLLEAR